MTNKNENKTYFLTKECRAELIGKHPFKHPEKFEYLVLVYGQKNTLVYKTFAVAGKKTYQQNTLMKYHIVSNYSNVKVISVEEIVNIL